MDCEELFFGQSGTAVAVVDGVEHRSARATAWSWRPARSSRSASARTSRSARVACMRTGGRAVMGGEMFAPPWTV